MRTMAMISMKNNAKDQKLRESLAVPSAKADGPSYPYGLEVTLEDSALKKLDMDVADYKVGDVLFCRVRMTVCRTSSNASDYGSNKSMGLQITDMDFSEED
jgi:hypothetical protein